MPKYIVSANVTISLYTIVDAESKEDAIAIAEDRNNCVLGSPKMFGQSPEYVWCHSGELDGFPFDLSAEIDES